MARRMTLTGHRCIYYAGNKYRVQVSAGRIGKDDAYAREGGIRRYAQESLGTFENLSDAIEKLEEWREEQRKIKELLKPPKEKRKKSCTYKGVTYRANYNRFVASYTIKGKTTHIGTYKTAEEARDAYLAAMEARKAKESGNE